MSTYNLLMSLYHLIEDNRPEGVKTVFEPGKPVGPYTQYLPAVIILTDNPSQAREYDSADTKNYVYTMSVHVFTGDYLARHEKRDRGNYEPLLTILDALADLLEADNDLGGQVDGLKTLEIHDLSPGHGWLRVTYELRLGRL